MSWRPETSMAAVEISKLGEFHPEEVLYEFDGPCIFTARSLANALLLAYLAEDLEADEALRYVVATTSENTVQELKHGLISVKQALTRGSLWLVDFDYSLRPRRAFAVTPDELPDDALPADGTMLWAHLEPALRVRLAGPEVESGRIPASAIAHAGEIAAKALKSVFEWAARDMLVASGGRPPDWLRQLYNLPAQRFAYGSLDVSFRAPDLPRDVQMSLALDGLSTIRSPEELAESGWRLLRTGLSWATSDIEAVLADSDEEQLAILEALRHLAPASTGPVTEVEITGSKVGSLGIPYRLDRNASKKIRTRLTALKKQREVQLRVFSGRVRGLDLDRLSFVLREIPGELPEIAFMLEDEQLLEIAREAFNQELEVTVVGRSSDAKTWTALELEFAPRSSERANKSHA